MAISVDGYGAIHKGNAKVIYLAYRRGEVELNKAQQTKCESFLSPEDIDEITYDEQVKAKDGGEKINTKNEDGETVQDNGNGTEAGGTAASAVGSAGTLTAVILGIKAGSDASILNGFVAQFAAAAALVGSIAAMTMAFLFDNQLGDREAKSQQSATDNQTMDGYSEGLGASMEMMEEDVSLYQEQSAQLTTVKNEQTSRGAELQMEYDTAMAMGDKAGAEKAKAEMQKLSETDNSKLEEGLEETGGAIEEYRSMNAESAAVAESGQTVSNFLKAGKTKATLAYINGALCAVGAIAAAIGAVKAAVPKIWTPFGPVDLPSCITAAIFWGSVGAMMGTAGTTYFIKGSKEQQCGNSGEEMQTHIDTLTDMMAQQTQYTEDTESRFEETDEESAESQEEAGKKAAGATSKNSKNLAGISKDDKEDKTEEKGAPLIYG